LLIVVKDINNSITYQIGISSANTIKKEKVFAKPFYPQNGPIEFDEKKLSNNVFMRYLIDTCELEGRSYHTGILN